MRTAALRLLDGAAALLVVTALAVLAWPVRVPRVAVTATGTETPVTLTPAGADADTLAQPLVNGNVFSARRRAPRTRFALPGQMAEPIALMPDAVAPEIEAEAGPQLVGVVAQDGVLRALLQFGDSMPPRLVRVGDRVRGVRVQRITAQSIVLSTAGGVRTLRLVREAVADSTGLLP